MFKKEILKVFPKKTEREGKYQLLIHSGTETKNTKTTKEKLKCASTPVKET